MILLSFTSLIKKFCHFYCVSFYLKKNIYSIVYKDLPNKNLVAHDFFCVKPPKYEKFK